MVAGAHLLPRPPTVRDDLPRARSERVPAVHQHQPVADRRPALGERVAAEPLVDVRFGHRVIGLDQDDTGVEVRVETPDRIDTMSGPYLLGCDGGGSTTRKLLGLSFDGHSYAEQFLIADIRAELPFPTERRFYFDPEWNPGRQVLVHPQPESIWRIDWQVPAEFDLDRERDTGRLDERIRRITGDAPYDIDWLSVYRFHQRVAESFRVGRVLLAGDSAHVYAPFGARGLNSGIQDAENAAWKLAFALMGWAGDELLESYQTERRAAALENLRVTDATMRFLAPHDDEQLARRRRLLDEAVADPGARRSVDSGKLAEPFWYIDSPLTTPAGDTSGFPMGTGLARPPVPGVLCPDGPHRVEGRPAVERLRERFGDGLVVLVAGADPEPVRAAVQKVGPPVEVDRLDDDGVLDALEARPGDAFIVRPDGHLAAIVDAVRHRRPHRRSRAGLRARLMVVPPLFARLVDDAGLFPPERLPMATAVARHRADARAGHRVLTHRFLCPASRLDELAGQLADDEIMRVGVVVDTDLDRLLAADRRLELETVEIALPRERPADGVEALAAADIGGRVFGEVPRVDGWRDALTALADHGLGAKVRCGGLQADLFPTSDELAGFVHSCATLDLPFKATAGLHHAVRHRDPATGFDHHGFLNLLVAVGRAVAGAAPGEVARALTLDNAAALSEEARAMAPTTVERTRHLLVAYGSCSTSEPIDDLVALGLVGPER